LPTKKRGIPDWFNQQDISSLKTWRVNRVTGAVTNEVTTYGTMARTPGRPIGSQVTESENHPDWNKRRRKPSFKPGLTGGPFFSQSSSVRLMDPHKVTIEDKKDLGFNNLDGYAKYTGFVAATDPSSVSLPASNATQNLAPLGSTAIARCKPTNQVAALSNFLAELYGEGLPKLFGATLWRDRTLQARQAGEEYLNSEFGWKPLVGDVQDISYALTHADTILSQYERGSGRMTRRRYAFPVEKTQSGLQLISRGFAILQQEDNRNPNALNYIRTGGNLYKISRTWRQVWFSGAFTYHLPTGYRSRNALISTAVKAKTLLGLDITPEVLWNAAPWSWAIDWFSNAGDVISNLSDWATDGLVLKYGYVMEHTVSTDTYFISDDLSNKAKIREISPVVASVETKRREVATPFGFGLTWSGLSPRQLAIAAALGLTRR